MFTPSRSRVAAALALTLAAGLGLAACSSSGSSSSGASPNCTPKHDNVQTVSEGKLTVGVIDLVPFSSYNSGDPNGIDVDIAKKAAAAECLTPAYQQATYGDAIQSIQNGALDIAIGSIDVTEKRLQAVDFTHSIYLDGMGIASKTNAKTIKDLESMDNVGTVDGYLWNEDTAKILGSKLKTYPSSVELKADFDAGRLDAALDAYATQTVQYKGDKSVTVNLVQQNPDKRVRATVQAPEAAFPLTKGNSSLKSALDADIDTMRKDGTIKNLLKNAGLTTALAKLPAKQYVVPAN